jgi:DNA gyrase subunit B
MHDAESIRRRPGMYVGDTTDGAGLMHMLWEVVANSLDEHLAGRCTTVRVELDGRAITVEDDGRGIPLEPINGVPFAQQALTSFHDTPTLDGHTPHEHIGKVGLGLFPICALSSELRPTVRRGGRCFSQQFSRGIATSILRDDGPTNNRGTRITFVPDDSIFKVARLDGVRVAERLHELAFLLPKLTLSLRDERLQTFSEPEGLLSLVKSKVSLDLRERPTLLATKTFGQINVEVAAIWSSGGAARVDSFANIERTTDGGTHVNGFRSGLLAGLKRAAPDLCAKYPARELDRALGTGLTAVVCVRLRDPDYNRPTRSRLVTPEARRAVRLCTAEALAEHLHQRRELLDQIETALARGAPSLH